jgi:hypothetical protein
MLTDSRPAVRTPESAGELPSAPAGGLIGACRYRRLLLPRCSLVLFHGGSGTLSHVVANGLPIVILPLDLVHKRLFDARVREDQAFLRELNTAGQVGWHGAVPEAAPPISVRAIGG